MTGVGVAVSPSFARGRAAAFSPADLGVGLLNWYDETSWTTSGANITAWNDLSSNGHNLSPTGGVAVNATGGPSGGPCIEFDGTSGSLRDTYTTGARRERVYLVCRPSAGGSPASGETMVDGAGGNSRRVYLSNPTTSFGLFAGAGLIDAGNNVTAWQLIDGDFNGAASSLRINGDAATTGSSGSVPTSGGLTLGRFGTPANYSDMCIVEGVITDGSEGGEVRDYLNAKWGLF